MEREKLEILKSIFGGYYRTGTEYLFHCPKCDHHKSKLSVNVEKNVFKCWVCEYAGTNIQRLVRRYGNYNHQKAWKKFQESFNLGEFEATVHSMFEKEEKDLPCLTPLPQEFISLANKNLPYSALPALKYLKDRGITKRDIVYWKIGYCPEGEYKNRIVIPSFNSDGHANFFVGRTYTDGWPKYMSPQAKRNNIIFNKLFLDFQSDITITEGVFDAIVAGPNAVPILGSNLRENSTLFQEIVKNDTPVYIALDVDAEKKAMRLIENLLKYDIELYKINIAPYNDLGEMSKDEFTTRKKEASFLTSENYLSYKISNLF